MEKKEIKKRGWVKNAAIIFLAVMLVLTFFSNTIMNWSLPEVSGQYTTRGSISSGISGTAKVTANVAYNVTISEGREIEKVHVKQGDTVEAGDLLFTLSEKDSAEVESAVEQLENLLYNYDVKTLNHSSADYSSLNDEIASLREQIADAEKEFSEHDGYQGVYDAEKAAYDAINDKLEALKEKQTELNDKLSELQRNEAGGYENVAAKLAEVESLTEALETARDALSELSETSTEVSAAEKVVESAEAALESAEDAVEVAQDNWSDAEDKYDDAVDRSDIYQRADVAYKTAEAYLSEIPEDAPEYASAKKAADDLKAKLQALTNPTDAEFKTLKKAIETAEANYDKALETRNKAKTELEKAKADLAKVKAANVTTDVSEEEYEAAEELVKSTEKAKTAAEKELTKLVKDASNDVKAQQKENDELIKVVNKELSEAKEKLDEAASDANSTVTEDSIKNLKKQLDSKLASLDKQKNSDAKSEKLFQMELERDMKEINKQREQINKLRAESISCEVTAKYSGTISSVSVMAGDTVNRDETMCQIEVNGKGYTASLSVTNEQASMVKVGDEATVGNFWWGNIYVKLAAIKADRSSPSTKKLLEFDVEGDVTDGQSLELTIGKKNTNYSNVVPNSAIREDSEGTFILAAVAKSTPLGNRYTATRMNVTVLESDDYNSAIDTGTSYGYDYIIVSSSKPVEAGMLVRLVEG